MRPVAAKTVIETLPLGECRKGDEVDIRFSRRASWKTIGEGVIEMIKPLARGGHQIKIRSNWRGSTIQKHDVPAGVTVERRRAPTAAELEADPSLAPLPERRTATHQGVAYEATDAREDPAVALSRAIARAARGQGLSERHLALGMGAMNMAAASLGIAALMSGGALVPVDD